MNASLLDSASKYCLCFKILCYDDEKNSVEFVPVFQTFFTVCNATKDDKKTVDYRQFLINRAVECLPLERFIRKTDKCPVCLVGISQQQDGVGCVTGVDVEPVSHQITLFWGTICSSKKSCRLKAMQLMDKAAGKTASESWHINECAYCKKEIQKYSNCSDTDTEEDQKKQLKEHVTKSMSVCGRCRSTMYCSEMCQKLHWTQHKDTCNRICLLKKAQQEEDKQETTKEIVPLRFSMLCSQRGEKRNCFHLCLSQTIPKKGKKKKKKKGKN